MKKFHTKEEMEDVLMDHQKKMTFMLRQAVDTMKLLGIGGIKQTVGGYKIVIKPDSAEGT